MAYSHNLVVNIFLRQFFRGIDDYTSWEKLYLESDLLPSTLFKNDEDIATVGWERAIKKNDGYSYMLFLSRIYEYLKKFSRNELSDQFPRGLPNFASSNSFILEDGVDWLQRSILEAPKPYLAYYHFLPPHFPYNTRIDFFQQFENDGYRPVDKPEHEYFAKDRTQEYLFESRQSYDEFILYCDEEFHRLYRFLDNQGFLENTWLVLTSDHGEMFERGIGGHITPVLYNPLMRIPLLIFPPGQQERIDIQTNTSAIDILPTLTHLTGQKIPEWTEGHVLPPFNINYEGDPPDVYGVRGRGIDKSQPINRGTFMIIRENFKGVFYLGYDGKAEKWGDYVEVFDIENDPEELENLAEVQPGITRDFSDTLLSQLEEKNKDYN
jgi:arylsulfatase A-like enzyme